jgi:hypothetical protein
MKEMTQVGVGARKVPAASAFFQSQAAPGLNEAVPPALSSGAAEFALDCKSLYITVIYTDDRSFESRWLRMG